MKALFVFGGGVILAILAIGIFLASRAFFAEADPALTPTDITITRPSPTSGELSFTTEKEAVASIECATSKEGPFSLCGAESSPTTSHQIKSSIILDPEKTYYFVIKIGNETYDNLGVPLELPVGADPVQVLQEFPTNLLGTCRTDPGFDETFDLNKDGCIRQNDRMLFAQ